MKAGPEFNTNEVVLNLGTQLEQERGQRSLGTWQCPEPCSWSLLWTAVYVNVQSVCHLSVSKSERMSASQPVSESVNQQATQLVSHSVNHLVTQF